MNLVFNRYLAGGALIKNYDYVIVGSGIAGLYMALLAREHGSVLLVTKGSIDDCNTRHAQGGIAAAIGVMDSPELHFKDTISAGAGLCNEEAVRILTDEAPDRIADLVKFGVPFDTFNGEIALTREAAHSMPRILHAGGDATGRADRDHPQPPDKDGADSRPGTLPGHAYHHGRRARLRA